MVSAMLANRRLLLLSVTLATAVTLGTGNSMALAAGSDPSTAPSDLFMQSVVTRDAELGWRQLCPAIQAQLPLAPLVQYVDALRVADKANGLAINVKFVNAVHRLDGGETRTYAATARFGDGRTIAKIFEVRTQASGCVESVT